MKTNKSRVPQKNKKLNTGKQSDIRDSLDSRKSEEQQFKGDDVTHNVKDVHNKPGNHK